jgi:hypothetical protein
VGSKHAGAAQAEKCAIVIKGSQSWGIVGYQKKETAMTNAEDVTKNQTNGLLPEPNKKLVVGGILAGAVLVLTGAYYSHQALANQDQVRLKNTIADQSLKVALYVGNANKSIMLTDILPQNRDAILMALSNGSEKPSMRIEIKDDSGRIGCSRRIKPAELTGLLSNVRPTRAQVEAGLDLLANICEWTPQERAAETRKLTYVAPPVQAAGPYSTVAANGAVMEQFVVVPRVGRS